MRIVFHGPTDQLGRRLFSLHWAATYNPGHPTHEHAPLERGQYFFANPEAHMTNNFRLVSAKELADLPSAWENSLVDARRYCQNVMYAYEVSAETYAEHKRQGGLCQQFKRKFYIA